MPEISSSRNPAEELPRGFFGYRKKNFSLYVEHLWHDESLKEHAFTDQVQRLSLEIARFNERQKTLADMSNHIQMECERLQLQLEREKINGRFAEEGANQEIQRLNQLHRQRMAVLQATQSRAEREVNHTETVIWQLSENLTRVLQESQALANQQYSSTTIETVWKDWVATVLGGVPGPLHQESLAQGVLTQIRILPGMVQVTSRTGEEVGVLHSVIMTTVPPAIVAYSLTDSRIIHADDVQVLRLKNLMVRAQYRATTLDSLRDFYQTFEKPRPKDTDQIHRLSSHANDGSVPAPSTEVPLSSFTVPESVDVPTPSSAHGTAVDDIASESRTAEDTGTFDPALRFSAPASNGIDLVAPLPADEENPANPLEVAPSEPSGPESGVSSTSIDDEKRVFDPETTVNSDSAPEAVEDRPVSATSPDLSASVMEPMRSQPQASVHEDPLVSTEVHGAEASGALLPDAEERPSRTNVVWDNGPALDTHSASVSFEPAPITQDSTATASEERVSGPSWYGESQASLQADSARVLLQLPGADESDAPVLSSATFSVIPDTFDQEPLPGMDSVHDQTAIPIPSWTDGVPGRTAKPSAPTHPATSPPFTQPSIPMSSIPQPMPVESNDSGSLDVRAFLFGKRVGQDIYSESEVIARSGDLITPDLVQRVEQAGFLPDLIVHMVF